ncbi:large cysteine rich protein [Cryptosporidium felis]|nr:large cysteine rich protein [Cryptosporidium felis]
MNISSRFTTEIAEGSCEVTHRSMICHGYPDEYSRIAGTLFSAMYQYFPVSEIPSFIEFCGIVHSIYTDIEINNSPLFFDAICAKHIHGSNLNVSFLTISILCSHISTNRIYEESYSISLLASEFFKKSKSINSLKKWEIQYFYPVAKRIIENIETDTKNFSSFNFKCVEITRSVISTDLFKLKLDDAISLCSGSIAFRTYCNDTPESNLQHLVSEIIQGITLTLNVDSFSEPEMTSICNAAKLIFDMSTEKLPISRNMSRAVKFPFFLNSCVEVLSSGVIFSSRFIEIGVDDAVSICAQSSRSSIPCKNESPLVSVFSVGLYSEIQYFPELHRIQVTDLCNISSKLIDVNIDNYLEICSRHLDHFKQYIPIKGEINFKFTEFEKQRICTRPYKWPKCNISESKSRGIHSIKLEKLASKLQSIFLDNKLNIWRFERHCVFAEKLMNRNGENEYDKCIKLLGEYEYLEMINKKLNEEINPLILYYKLEDETIKMICNSVTRNYECVNSASGLSGLLATDFFSLSTKYLDLNSIRKSDFCIISDILLQKGSLQEMKQTCPYILSQITNIEHWPQIILTPELTHTICNSLSILNLNCIEIDIEKGITKELSSGINEVAIELFFLRKKYTSSFNPKSSCQMAESLIQYGVKNEYFDNLCINLFSHDIWNSSGDYYNKYNHYFEVSKQDPVTFFELIKSEAIKLCKELEDKLSLIYAKSHNSISKKDKSRFKPKNKLYYQSIFVRSIDNESNNNYVNSNKKLTKKEERIALKKKLVIISKAKGYVSLSDEAIKNYTPEGMDYKLANKYYADFPDSYKSLNESNFVFKLPEINWDFFTEKLAHVSKENLGITIKVNDPKFGGLAELIHKWGYYPQGTIQGAQYIYRVSRYLNKYMISPKKAYIIWKEVLISMNHSIIPKWRESWADEIRRPSALDEQPLPSCEGVKSNRLLKQLGMERKKISMVALANIDSFVSQLTEAAHDFNLHNAKFSDFCLVGIILFFLKSYSRTESFNYQCTKWVKEIGYVDNYVEKIDIALDENAFSKRSVNRLKQSVRRQISPNIARKICASTNRWMSCNGGSSIDEKLNIDNLATELVRLSRISGLEFRDMCEVAIQIANSHDFNKRCPILLQQVIGNYNRAHHVCKSTSFWKSCPYSKTVIDLKLKEHLDNLTLELTIGLNEIYPNIFTFEEICQLSDRFVASEYFKMDCTRSLTEFLITQRFIKPTLNIYGQSEPSVSFKHIISVALAVCYDTLRWQQATCTLDEGHTLFEKQWVDLVSEEILSKMVELKSKDSQVSLFFKDNERDQLVQNFNTKNNNKFQIFLPPPLKYSDICEQVSTISKTRYFNINCIQAVTEIFQIQISKMKSTSEILGNFEAVNIYGSIIKAPKLSTVENICKGSIFWESCSSEYLRPLFKFDIEDNKREAVDIIVNDIMVSVIQLNEPDFDNDQKNAEYTDIQKIHELASKTVSLLSFLDFCEIGIWYSKKISDFDRSQYPELQNLLSEKILVLLLEKMYPNRRIEKNNQIEECENRELGTLEKYIEDSILELPKIQAKLVRPPPSMFRKLTNFQSILTQHSQNYKHNIYQIVLPDKDIFDDFYIKRNITSIEMERYGNYLTLRPAVGLKPFMYQLPNGKITNVINEPTKKDFNTKKKDFNTKKKDFNTLKKNLNEETRRPEIKKINYLMKKNPGNFHSSIFPHATFEIIRKEKPNRSERKIRKEWYKSTKKKYYYLKGREIAKKEWELRAISLSNNNGTGEIKWEVLRKKKINFIHAMFNSESRKKMKEDNLLYKGIYRARVHQFLLEKLLEEQKFRKEKGGELGEIVTEQKFGEKADKSGLTSIEGIYSDREIGTVTNIAAIIGYNQIAVDLI